MRMRGGPRALFVPIARQMLLLRSLSRLNEPVPVASSAFLESTREAMSMTSPPRAECSRSCRLQSDAAEVERRPRRRGGSWAARCGLEPSALERDRASRCAAEEALDPGRPRVIRLGPRRIGRARRSRNITRGFPLAPREVSDPFAPPFDAQPCRLAPADTRSPSAPRRSPAHAASNHATSTSLPRRGDLRRTCRQTRVLEEGDDRAMPAAR
jgi:hypothetical protein